MEEIPKIGDFEAAILAAIETLEVGTAYGVPIRHELEARLKRDVAVGALYTVLGRLEEKGLVRSWEGEKTAKRGGRAKRYYILEGAGERALHAKRQEHVRMNRVLGISLSSAGGR